MHKITVMALPNHEEAALRSYVASCIGVNHSLQYNHVGQGRILITALNLAEIIFAKLARP